MKQILAGLESSAAPEHARVLARLRPELVEEIRAAPRLDWLTLTTNLELVRAITMELGVERGEDFFHHTYAKMLDGPVLGALFRGVRTLGADNPASFLKHAPRAYGIIFREVGTVSVGARTRTSLDLEYAQLPPEVFDAATPWLRYAAASYRSLFDVSGKPGDFRIVTSDRATGRCTIRFEWSE